MRAIVLSGGGSKGAYQIGVWKALRQLKIRYEIVTGTSVGALNAALMVQNDYFKAMMLWYNLKSSMIYDNDVEIQKTKDFFKYAKNIVLDGGMQVNNLSKTVDKYLNINKIYKSNINLGIVTVKYPSLEALELTRDDISKEQLKDYLLASASPFPAFQKKQIGEEHFIDGGFYDNLPINLAIDMGADEIIAVDLEAIGRKQKVKNKNVKIILISPRGDTGSFLVFDKVSSRRSMALGYNDTMKTFGKLDGNIYTFKLSSLHKNYIKYKERYLSVFHELINGKADNILTKLLQISVYKSFFDNKVICEKEWNEMIERTADILHIDSTKIYSINRFHKELFASLLKITNEDEFIQNISKSKLKLLFHEDVVVLHMYHVLLEEKNISSIYNLILVFPNAFLSALYLYVIH